ncbi:MAG TPA: flagellar hook-associated protein FlgK [Lachnospiraceae bacterium]|nr:flagellar hook-associated protein FlgK [Lachnospiraceae bacterium]
MPSQFFGLNIAYTGLTASNAALNTTANNISNVQTVGYSRQTVVQEATEALRTFTTYGCAGAGVDTIAIERMRNEFYDVRYWNNNANVGEYESKSYYMKQLEDYFVDDATNVGFNTIFNQMVNGISSIQTNAGDTTVKAQFIGFANNLAEYFNNMAMNLENMQKDANAEMKVQIDKINSIATQIASLNKQINVIEISGPTANELRDQRGVLIDELSKVVDVKTSETPVYDSNQPDRLTGANNFMVTIAGGQTLVNTNEYNSLKYVARSNLEKVNQSDADGLYDVFWTNGIEFNLNNAAMQGELKGLVELRDGNNGEYFNGKVSATGTTFISGNSYNTVKVDVSADYLKDLSKCTLSDSGGKIKLGNQIFSYDSWTYNYDDSTDSYSYTFVLSDTNESTVSSNRIGKEASVGTGVAYQGIPYYMEQMNEWLRSYSKAFNDTLAQTDSVDSYGNDATFLFMANSITSNMQYDFSDSYQGTGSISISSSDNSYYRLTAKTFAINNAMIKDANLFATHTGATSGQEKYDVVKDLIDLQTNKKSMSFRGASAGEFLQCMLSDVALNASSANTFSKNYTTISSAIDNLRNSISGVDEDEEAISLIKYQNGYNLASKMIQTLTEVYDRLILQTGV